MRSVDWCARGRSGAGSASYYTAIHTVFWSMHIGQRSVIAMHHMTYIPCRTLWVEMTGKRMLRTAIVNKPAQPMWKADLHEHHFNRRSARVDGRRARTAETPVCCYRGYQHTMLEPRIPARLLVKRLAGNPAKGSPHLSCDKKECLLLRSKFNSTLALLT